MVLGFHLNLQGSTSQSGWDHKHNLIWVTLGVSKVVAKPILALVPSKTLQAGGKCYTEIDVGQSAIDVHLRLYQQIPYRSAKVKSREFPNQAT